MLDPLLHASDIVANKTVNNIFFIKSSLLFLLPYHPAHNFAIAQNGTILGLLNRLVDWKLLEVGTVLFLYSQYLLWPLKYKT